MRKKFFSLLTAAVLLYILDYFRLIESARLPAEPLIVGVKKSLYQGFSQLKILPKVVVNYDTLVEAVKKNRQLTNENNEMRMKIGELVAENESLRKQLGAPLPASFRFIPADVIAVSRYMEIAIGSQNGVKAGMPVVDGSTFIGRISKTTDRRSLVILLTDNDLNVPVISNRGTRGKVNGQLGKLVLLNQVLQRDPLFLDDIFFTSGEEGFPPKLLIGKVVHIDTDDVDVYKQAQIAPYAEIDLIKKVFVLEER